MFITTDDIEKLTTPSTSRQASKNFKRKGVTGMLLVVISVVYVRDNFVNYNDAISYFDNISTLLSLYFY